MEKQIILARTSTRLGIQPVSQEFSLCCMTFAGMVFLRRKSCHFRRNIPLRVSLCTMRRIDRLMALFAGTSGLVPIFQSEIPNKGQTRALTCYGCGPNLVFFSTDYFKTLNNIFRQLIVARQFQFMRGERKFYSALYTCNKIHRR